MSLDEERVQLTGHEVRLLRLAAQRKQNKEIARELGISRLTVKNEFSILYRKMGALNRLDAVLLAIEQGLIEFPKRDVSGGT